MNYIFILEHIKFKIIATMNESLAENGGRLRRPTLLSAKEDLWLIRCVNNLIFCNKIPAIELRSHLNGATEIYAYVSSTNAQPFC